MMVQGGDDGLTTIIPEDGFPIATNTPLVREAIADWMRKRGGSLSDLDFSDAGNPKWNVPDSILEGCSP